MTRFLRRPDDQITVQTEEEAAIIRARALQVILDMIERGELELTDIDGEPAVRLVHE